LAACKRATPGQIARAWLLRRSAATIAIPGTSSLTHLEENVHAREIDLSPDDLGMLGRLATVP
jgi:pyridoxine 4-dehydrogenase